MSLNTVEYDITTNEDGYKIINLYKNGVECATMMFRLILNDNGIQQLNISSVECYCPILKGICFPKLMEILIINIENRTLFGFAIKPKIEVALFVSPHVPDPEKLKHFYNESEVVKIINPEYNEPKATEKLTRLYNKYGFRRDHPDIPSYLVSRLDIIRKVVFNGVKMVNSPYKTPQDSPVTISPMRPKKNRSAKSVDLKPTNLFSQLTKAIPSKRYMSTTVSSRAKKRKGGTRKKK
jgi:hypothetical protein